MAEKYGQRPSTLIKGDPFDLQLDLIDRTHALAVSGGGTGKEQSEGLAFVEKILNHSANPKQTEREYEGSRFAKHVDL